MQERNPARKAVPEGAGRGAATCVSRRPGARRPVLATACSAQAPGPSNTPMTSQSLTWLRRELVRTTSNAVSVGERLGPLLAPQPARHASVHQAAAVGRGRYQLLRMRLPRAVLAAERVFGPSCGSGSADWRLLCPDPRGRTVRTVTCESSRAPAQVCALHAPRLPTQPCLRQMHTMPAAYPAAHACMCCDCCPSCSTPPALGCLPFSWAAASSLAGPHRCRSTRACGRHCRGDGRQWGGSQHGSPTSNRPARARARPYLSRSCVCPCARAPVRPCARAPVRPCASASVLSAASRRRFPFHLASQRSAS